jgi:hypothetical protein
VYYLCLLRPLYFDADQVQVFIIEIYVNLAILALLAAAALALSCFVLFVLVYYEACALL